MYVVLAVGKNQELDGNLVYGPYRHQDTAGVIKAMLENPFASDWLDPEHYTLTIKETLHAS